MDWHNNSEAGGECDVVTLLVYAEPENLPLSPVSIEIVNCAMVSLW
ncbi:hypothetical protein SAMN04487856_105372 [Pseudomonas sp. ok266]|jgi:hypothetical protein|nr:hypothetical protein SAMN04487856_105372 [Pseudomonas sp. ok266]